MHPSAPIQLSPSLIVQHTNTPRGRGVFTTQDHPQGAVIEVSPIIEIHHLWNQLPQDIKRVVYDWGYLTGKPPNQCFGIALGVGSLFNHQDAPNVSYHADIDRQALIFTAIRDIEPGEELTINYNSDIAPQSGTNWFDEVGVKQLD